MSLSVGNTRIFRRKPVEQVEIHRPLPLRTKIFHGLDQSVAKELHPGTVHRDTCS